MSIKRESITTLSSPETETVSKKRRKASDIPEAHERTTSVIQNPSIQAHELSTRQLVYSTVPGSENQSFDLSNWCSLNGPPLREESLDDEGSRTDVASSHETRVKSQATEESQCNLLKTCMKFYDDWSNDFENMRLSCRATVRYLSNFSFYFKLSGSVLDTAAINGRIEAFISAEIEILRRLVSEDNCMLLRINSAFPEAKNKLSAVEKIFPLSIGLGHPLLLFHSKQASTIAERISINSKTLEYLKDIAGKKHTKQRDRRTRIINNLFSDPDIIRKYEPLSETLGSPEFSLLYGSSEQPLIQLIGQLPPWIICGKYFDLCEEGNSLRSKESLHIASLNEVAQAERKLCERKDKLLSEVSRALYHGKSADLNTADKPSLLKHECNLLSSDYPFSEAFDVPYNIHDLMSFVNKLKWCIKGDIIEPQRDIPSVHTTQTSDFCKKEHNYKSPEYKNFTSSESYSFPRADSLRGQIFRQIANEMIDDYDPSRLWLPDKLLEIESRLLKMDPMKFYGDSDVEHFTQDHNLTNAVHLLISGSKMVSQLEPSIRETSLLVRSLLSDGIAMLSQVQKHFPEAEHKLDQMWSGFTLDNYYPKLLNIVDNKLQGPLSGHSSTVSGRINTNRELLEKLEKDSRGKNQEELHYHCGNTKLDMDSMSTAVKEEHNGKNQKAHDLSAGALLLATRNCKNDKEISWIFDELCDRLYMWNSNICERLANNGNVCVYWYESMQSAFIERKNACSLLLNHFSGLLSLQKFLSDHGLDTNQTIGQVKDLCSYVATSRLCLVDDGSLESFFYPMKVPSQISDRMEFCEKLLACTIGDIAPNESLVEYADLLKLPDTGILTLDRKALINPLKEKVRCSSGREDQSVESYVDEIISHGKTTSRWYRNRHYLFDFTEYRIFFNETRLGLRHTAPNIPPQTSVTSTIKNK